MTRTDTLYERLLEENPGNLIYLEEMLHHARQMERKLDEAREARDNLKQELEIVTARLHGKKHPLDNGIPERHEVYIFKNGKYELDT